MKAVVARQCLLVLLVMAPAGCRLHGPGTSELGEPTDGGAGLGVAWLPGAPPPPPGLSARLQAALAAKGATYVPRTRHRVGNAPRYTNRLILETSPYLLQHAHNPVDWHAWGDEAFAEARRRGLPLFLSIGYSTCHWCHVMEDESFEDEEIARFMNEHYVCIKVDREERPDVDAVYMSAVQALTGSRRMADERVAHAGARAVLRRHLLPASRRRPRGESGFLTLLQQLSATYLKDPARIAQQASELAAAVRRDLEGPAAAPTTAATAASVMSGGLPDAGAIAQAVGTFKRSFDDQNGGLRGAPKFPSSLSVRLLLRDHRRTGDAEALRMATLTLEKMAAGGIYDQLGGGFHRYATDAAWQVPHFEKMLYDNALLAVDYLEAYQVTGRADFARVGRETLDYLLGEMASPEGGFYSATDADSDGERGSSSSGRTRSSDPFSVPTPIDLPATTASRPAATFRVATSSTSRTLTRPNGRRSTARGGGSTRSAPAGSLPPATRRSSPPGTAWRSPPWRRAVGSSTMSATSAPPPAPQNLLLSRLRVGGRLMRSFKDGRASQPGFLEDYALVAAGLYDLYEASFDPRWLREALALCNETERLFADPGEGGWFTTAADHEKLMARERPRADGPTPSGTSVALMNALRAAAFTGDDHWRAIADRALFTLRDALTERPTSLSDALLALDFRTDAVREVVVVWPKEAGSASAASLLSVLRRTFLPNRALAGSAEGDALAALATLAPIVEGKRALRGRSTAYVCERGHCQLPTSDPTVLRRQLGRSSATSVPTSK